MEIKKLTGGKVIGAKQADLPVSLNAEPARIRVCSPGNYYGNVANHAQLRECAKLDLGMPEVHRVKALFREIEGVLHFLLAPTLEQGPDTYAVKVVDNALKIKQMKPLYDGISFTLRRDVWYVMNTEIVEDELLKFAVMADWTHAALEPREIKKRTYKKNASKSDKKSQKSEAEAQPTATAETSTTTAAGTPKTGAEHPVAKGSETIGA